MKISLQWINEFVDVADYLNQPEPLAVILTQAGLEVEEMQNLKARYHHVVVGQVVEKDKHPQADKLTLCQVAIGKGEIQQIVCGATNHKKGDYVVVALPGAVLPGNFAIKVSTIRGISSSGMLCSVKELGLATESDGILILPNDAPIGEGFAKYYGLEDVVFELKVTPNRADCLSHYGLAREISALTGRALKPVTTEKISGAPSPIKVEIVNPELCPRYTGRYFKNIVVAPSPMWLRRRLESVGLNSINNVVDVTNYIMMEWGQPLHAFDADAIQGGVLKVQAATKGESFTTFDKTQLKLEGDELTIRDANLPLCLAGVIGSPNSGVSIDSKNLFLESAYFSSSSLRKTSRRFGIQTDAAYRFTRGVDAAMTLTALEKATELLQKITTFAEVSQIEDKGQAVAGKKPIAITVQTVSDRLGYEATAKEMKDIFTRLGCVVQGSGPEFQVTPPSFRTDLETDMDLVEEYARIYGYQHIPETLPALHVKPGSHESTAQSLKKIRHTLVEEGVTEAMHMIFSPEKKVAEFFGGPGFLQVVTKTEVKPVKLLNPLSEEMSFLRTSLTYGLTETLVKNFHQGNQSGRLFEIGRVFTQSASGYSEYDHLALCFWGSEKNLWNKSQDILPVFEIKTALESLLRTLGKKFRWVSFSELNWNQLHPGQTIGLEVEGQLIGFMASLHPRWSDDNKIRVPAAVAEIHLPKLLQAQAKGFKFASLHRYPKVERDFSFQLPASSKAGDIMQVLKSVSGHLFVEAVVFDLYKNETMKNGERSLAFRLSLQDAQGTLQEAQLQKIQDEVFKRLRDKNLILN